MWSYRQRTDFDKDEPRKEKEMFGWGLGWEGGRKGEFQISNAHVTHIDWLKIHHLALETFEVRSKTCNILQSKMLREKSSAALCYMTMFCAVALREKSALQVGSCNTACFVWTLWNGRQLLMEKIMKKQLYVISIFFRIQIYDFHSLSLIHCRCFTCIFL